MIQNTPRSHCPVNFALESFGDSWSLLIIRDIVFWNKKSFKEFLSSEEGIATNILSSRLDHLIDKGILIKEIDEKDHRKVIYKLTEKGLDLIPLLLEMSGWAKRHDSETTAPKEFVEYIFANREKMYQLIREIIQNGGSLFVGNKSVISVMRQKRWLEN